MSARDGRFDRVLRVRDERLKQAVLALEQARAQETRVRAELEHALQNRKQAEDARRELGARGAEMLDFIEAEEWLRSCAIAEELAIRRMRQAHAQFERAQLRVKDARIKVRQLEQLKERSRLRAVEKEKRAQRVLDDEIGQRIAQSQRRPR